MDKIRKIIIDNDDDVTFFFEGSEEGFSATEFKWLTRIHLDRIQYEIDDYNSEVELRQNG